MVSGIFLEGNTSLRINDLQIELIKNGFSSIYISRIISELTAHKEDIAAELVDSGFVFAKAEDEAAKRLGNVSELSSGFVSMARKNSLFGRFPPLLFILLPFLLIPLSFFSVIFCGNVITIIFNFFNIDINWTAEPLYSITKLLFVLHNNIIHIIITLMFCFICRRYIINMKWALLTSFIMAVTGFFLDMGITRSISDHLKKYVISFNIRLYISQRMFFNTTFIVNYIRFLTPVICFMIFCIFNSYSIKKKISRISICKD
jgi:hypothetical protein